MKLRFLLLLFILTACATGAPSGKSVPFFVGDTSDPAYAKLWTSANEVTAKYFKIQKSDRHKGIIVTAPREERDAFGKEVKRGFVTIIQADKGYDVKVEVPYLKYSKQQNEYTENVKGDKHLLVVERKQVPPPSKTDIYLESLIRSEILKQSGKS